MKSQRKFAFASLIKNQSRPLRALALVRRSTTPPAFAAGAPARALDPRGGLRARSSLPLAVRPLPIFEANEVRA
ncbi:hypothetical protein DEM26_08960 [Thioclava sp. NG1]|nr:hypothetical protein DEM26_08960 [Thioclava sp. NG1]